MKNVSEESREKWLPCFQPELVSSEESGDEDGGEDIIIWRVYYKTTCLEKRKGHYPFHDTST